MTGRMIENREGSLGCPGFVKPVITKESKPLGKRKRSLGHLGIVTPVITKRSNLLPSRSEVTTDIPFTLTMSGVSFPKEDKAKRNIRTTAQQVANQFLAASGKQISRKTVARRLRGGGLYARRPVVCVPLTRQYRIARLQWCREHHNWTEQDWACVLFSDESRFSLSSDCKRQLIWRKSGTAYRPENIQEKDRYPTCSIMV
ncbi:transposable element Tcb2 transposase [Trichonephila clavipes]|nr:transposable element Tcb2 transposase [Trichonephila clavipes]